MSEYSEYLKEAIKKSGKSLSQISRDIESFSLSADTSYISRISNDKQAVASDEMNNALAQILNIDSLDLRTMAWISKIPKDVLQNIKGERVEAKQFGRVLRFTERSYR